MYLHEDKESFRDIIEMVADHSGRTPIVVEKDYYVTLILRLLAQQLEHCVFKGGTAFPFRESLDNRHIQYIFYGYSKNR